MDYKALKIEPVQLPFPYVIPAYRLVDQTYNSWLYLFRTYQEAQKTMNIIQYYQVNEDCYAGRPGHQSMHYFKSNGKSLSGDYPGDDAMTFNRSNLRIVLNPIFPSNIPSYKIMDGNSVILDCHDSYIMALRAIEFINRYKFNKICFVGKPINDDFGMTYFTE